MRSRLIIDEFSLVTTKYGITQDKSRLWFFDKDSSFVPFMGLAYFGYLMSFASLKVEVMPELIYICRSGI